MITVGHMQAWEMDNEMGKRSPVEFTDAFRKVLDTSYNPRHVPAIHGPVYILNTHVCLADVDTDEDVDRSIYWFNEAMIAAGEI